MEGLHSRKFRLSLLQGKDVRRQHTSLSPNWEWRRRQLRHLIQRAPITPDQESSLQSEETLKASESKSAHPKRHGTSRLKRIRTSHLPARRCCLSYFQGNHHDLPTTPAWAQELSWIHQSPPAHLLEGKKRYEWKSTRSVINSPDAVNTSAFSPWHDLNIIKTAGDVTENCLTLVNFFPNSGDVQTS